ncbi:cysteine-rich receptor-like protein kinase 10 [Papaver somniferum]|uniref:cysteine-rich receptor-like protein kinase 10 n=1 Tax=Papaver somniferum TaxID=3469 RepID=UPI000E6FDA59|nr:cysteine-rich receptor-like protein kinase 10 [Papaver somniferum]
MNNLESNATLKSSKFEVDSIEYNDFSNIYGIVECTRDLSRDSCTSFLQDMISRIPGYLNGLRGGHIYTQSCFLRYYDHLFYELVPPPPPSGPSPSDFGKVTDPLPGPKPSPNTVAVAVPVVVGVLLILVVCFYFSRRKRRVTNKFDIPASTDPIENQDSLQFDLVTIRNATDEFSDANKLGEGGFGVVYKGRLQNGQEIAVKRLSVNSGQGLQEFKNEVVLLNKLQHRNLVRLLGFCFQGHEQILIYEHVSNGSLDKYLFVTERKVLLDWEKRYKIIGGIARGLLYLHEDFRLRIIHRDLKAGNILLAEEMEAKIADFGMAKLFEIDQTQGNTSRIAGTYGYMAPEYVLHGLFSVKSDVYSFGVLLLEIVSGRNISSFYESASSPDLLSYVSMENWREGTALELMDPILSQMFSRNEVIRSIHIGLLCVQDNIEDRPTMSSVVLMLSSYSITLASPSQPAYFAGSVIGLNMPNSLEQSKSSSKPYSVNDISCDPVKLSKAQRYLEYKFGTLFLFDMAKGILSPTAMGITFPDSKQEFMEMIVHGIQLHVDVLRNQNGEGEEADSRGISIPATVSPNLVHESHGLDQLEEEANSSSSDPSIPPGFETYNRFQGIEEDQEVASKISDINTTKPALSEPFQEANTRVHRKKKCSSNPLTSPSKISAGNLMEFGSIMG